MSAARPAIKHKSPHRRPSPTTKPLILLHTCEPTPSHTENRLSTYAMTCLYSKNFKHEHMLGKSPSQKHTSKLSYGLCWSCRISINSNNTDVRGARLVDWYLYKNTCLPTPKWSACVPKSFDAIIHVGQVGGSKNMPSMARWTWFLLWSMFKIRIGVEQ
jgi:hypothetical protein